MLNLGQIKDTSPSITIIIIKNNHSNNINRGNCINHINNIKGISSNSRDTHLINSNKDNLLISSSRGILLINKHPELTTDTEILIDQIKKNSITNQANTITIIIKRKFINKPLIT